MNLLFRFAFIVISTFLGFSNLWGWSAAPVWNGSEWCSYNNVSGKELSGGQLYQDAINTDVYSPCTSDIYFSVWNNKALGVSGHTYFEFYSNGNSSYFARGDWKTGEGTTNVHYTSVPTDMYNLRIYRNGRTQSTKISNIKIPLAKHIRLYDSTNANSNRDGGTTNLTINEQNDPNHAKVGQAKEIIIPFRSFLTNGNITVKSAVERQQNSETEPSQTTIHIDANGHTTDNNTPIKTNNFEVLGSDIIKATTSTSATTVINQTEQPSPSINIITERAERVRKLLDTLKNNPDGTKIVAAQSLDEYYGAPQYHTVKSNESEISQTAISADGILTSPALLTDVPD